MDDAKVCLLVLLLLITPQAAEAQSDAQRLEIHRMISRMESADCTFERNGRWYDGKQAQAHLQRKFAYLEKRGLADSAEHFIERAASTRSFSGRPYHVLCPGQAAVESGAWFNAVLRTMRDGSRTTPTR